MFENLRGAACDRVLIIFTSGEGRVGDVFEPDVELVAGQALLEVLHLKVDSLEVLLDDAAEVDGVQRGIPGCPEGQPR